MKNSIVLIALLALVNITKAQDTTSTDTTSVRIGKREFTITDDGITIGKNNKPPKAKAYFGGLGLGFNVLTDLNGNAALKKPFTAWENEPVRSMTWNINFYDYFLPITKDRHSLGLVSGLGLTYKGFSLIANDQDIFTNSDTTFLFTNPDGREYNKRKFRIAYITVPLMLSFNTSSNAKKNFHISAGVLGNLRIGSVYKKKFDSNGEERKEKKRDDFNLEPLAVDLTFRVGYRDYTFFVNYGVTPLFKANRAPQLTPLTFGVQF